MLSVIVITYRNPGMLDLCLKSLTENKALDDTEIIVVVDGFIGESASVLQKYTGIKVLDLDQNQGQNRAHNVGVYQANGDWILILNDDNIVPKNYDKRLIQAQRENAVISINQIEPQPSIFRSFVIKDFGITPSTFQYEQFLEYEYRLRDEALDRSIIMTYDGNTWPPYMQKKHYMMVGGIDTSFPGASHADHDLFTKFKLAGLASVRYHQLHIYHFASRSESSMEKEYQTQNYFRWKWGFQSVFNEDNSHIPLNTKVRGIDW